MTPEELRKAREDSIKAEMQMVESCAPYRIVTAGYRGFFLREPMYQVVMEVPGKEPLAVTVRMHNLAAQETLDCMLMAFVNGYLFRSAYTF